MFLFKVGVLNFDISALIAFLIGIFFAAVLLLLFYLVMVLSSLKSRKYVVSEKDVTVTDEEIKEIIANAFLVFDDKDLRGANSLFKHTINICIDLVYDISRKFFPKSKRPFAELSIDEALMLLKYVSDRMNEILDRPFLRKFKKIRISTILSLNDVKTKIDSSALMKATKKYKLKKVFKTALGIINLFNPVYWVRKIVINSSLDFVTKKLCKALIGIVGEETYNVYSKRVFNEDKSIDVGVSELVDSASNDLKDIDEKEIDDYLSAEKYLEVSEDEKEKKWWYFSISSL